MHTYTVLPHTPKKNHCYSTLIHFLMKTTSIPVPPPAKKIVHTYTLESRSSSMVLFVTASAFPVACSRHLGLLATFL